MAEGSREEHQKQLDALAEKAQPMAKVVLDGGNMVAYFVAKHPLLLEETVVSIPLNKLMTLQGQILQSIVAPLMQGRIMTVEKGGAPRDDTITS